MRTQQVVITGPGEVELQESVLDETVLGPTQLLIETRRTFISAGTELSIYTGIEPRVLRAYVALYSLVCSSWQIHHDTDDVPRQLARAERVLDRYDA